jgi:hypothetical protein
MRWGSGGLELKGGYLIVFFENEGNFWRFLEFRRFEIVG